MGVKKKKEGISPTQAQLDEVYAKYPRKLGKSAGMKTARRVIESEEDLKQLSQAVDNYIAHCRRERTEKSYVMYFSTFMNCWKDWLDEGHGSAEDFANSSPDFSDIFGES